MKSATHPHSLLWYVIIVGALAALFAMMMTRPAAQSGAPRQAEVLSFDMWCLEMQLYSQTRCDAHAASDVKDYEKYRASVEAYQSGKQSQAARDKGIQDRLNRDPNAKATGNIAR